MTTYLHVRGQGHHLRGKEWAAGPGALLKDKRVEPIRVACSSPLAGVSSTVLWTQAYMRNADTWPAIEHLPVSASLPQVRAFLIKESAIPAYPAPSSLGSA